MKRILILNHNQENFGTYYRCLFLGRELAKRGYGVTMVSASGRAFDLLVRRRPIAERFELITLPRVRYHKYFTGQILLRLPLMLIIALFSRYDLCYAFAVAQPQVGLPAWAAKAVRRKKLIVDWDDLWAGGFAQEHIRPVESVLGFSERFFVRFADRITYVSEEIGRRIDALGLGARKAKIPNGSDAERIRPLDRKECRARLGWDPDGTCLVSVGNTYTGSLGLMLEAFRQFRKTAEAKLAMVGAGEIRPEFSALFASLGKDVLLAGQRPLAEMPLYLGAADALLLPMDDSLAERSRFPMRLGDYLASGRPIVSNAVGEVRYYLENNEAGLVSDPRSAEAFAGNIARAINERSLAERIGTNARRLAEGELGWPMIADRLDKEVIRRLWQNEQ